MVIYLRSLTSLFVFLFSITQVCHAVRDRTHTPSYVFDYHASGQKALNPARVTNASFAHLKEIKGRTKTGKRLLTAVIDACINPTLPHMKELKEKGLIHSAAFAPNNPYMINADEDFEKHKSTIQRLEDTRWNLLQKETSFPLPTPEERERIKQQQRVNAKDLGDYEAKDRLLQSRKFCLGVYNELEANNHGSGVIHALHKIAPESSILPIDLITMGHIHTNSKALTEAIRVAIRYRADCINLSRSLNDLNQEGFEALAEAAKKGILIVTSAGNDSYPGIISYIRNFYDTIKNVFVKSNEQKLFERLKGRGIIFAGSSGINSSGKEELSSYSQHPEEDTKRNFILAPGEKLNIQTNKNPYKLVNGTSFSAPVIAGAFLNLKQYCLDKNYKATTEKLHNILYDSGHDITYARNWPWEDINYKAVDVWKACQHADEIFNPKPVPPRVLKPAQSKGKPTKSHMRRNVARKSTAKPATRRVARHKRVAVPPKKNVAARKTTTKSIKRKTRRP